jgi:hypothetical protein
MHPAQEQFCWCRQSALFVLAGTSVRPWRLYAPDHRRASRPSLTEQEMTVTTIATKTRQNAKILRIIGGIFLGAGFGVLISVLISLGMPAWKAVVMEFLVLIGAGLVRRRQSQ